LKSIDATSSNRFLPGICGSAKSFVDDIGDKGTVAWIHCEAGIADDRVKRNLDRDIDLLDGCKKAGIGIDVDKRNGGGDEVLNMDYCTWEIRQRSEDVTD
jgi:hypothetical protein